MKALNLGHSDFKNIIEENNYFIDKSLLIEEVITVQKNVLLLPRPRRFGKTLNLSMLRYFFDKTQPENINLFKELNIWKNQELIEKHCCKYPVIYLSFKDTKAENWQDTFTLIKKEISKAYEAHYYLLKSDCLHDYEKKRFSKIIERTADDIDFNVSLSDLSSFLSKHHKQKVVILIDEYDSPIQSGYKKFYNEVVNFMRIFLSGAFKDNSTLYKGIITGILRVSRESIFSGLNNLSVYSILDEEFSDKFGFTENEVFQLIKDFEVKTDYAEIKKWYNGYKFGDTSQIYNPWSILSFVVSKNERFKTYWSNTSANELIKQQIRKKEANNIREEVLKLINNEPIVKDIEENFVFSDLDTPKEVLWTLLTFSGYLTTRKHLSRKKHELIIPNYELKTIFQDTIVEWFEADVKVQQSLLENTANFLIRGDLIAFEKGFKKIMGDTFSYYDTAKTNEYVYHAYILGLLAIIGDDYMIKSNKESGLGRYDIMLIPHNTSTSLSTGKLQNGVVIEIKQIDKQKEKETDTSFHTRINSSLQEAIAQIDKNKYYNELLANKITEPNIVKVPIVFAGKEVFVNIISS